MKLFTFKSLKKAFTLVELIFIIIIMGILASAAVMSIPDNHLYSDIHFVSNKIKAKQMNAMLYDWYDFSDPSWRNTYHDETCIDTATLKTDEQNSKQARKYKLRATLDAQKICFDSLGRPYKDDYALNNLIKQPIIVNIEYKNTIRKISIMPYTGCIMIRK